MYKFKNKSNKKMLKNLSRKISKQSKRIGKRFNKTIKNDSIKVRQFYKSMLKKFKGGCTNCATIGGKPMKEDEDPLLL